MKRKRTQEVQPTKITINVWAPVWAKLETALQLACLKRDAYIAALVERELNKVESEVPIPNSEKARQFIARQLRALLENNATPLSIAMPAETAARLEKVCRDRRIVRDAFFNRLFLFLGFGPGMAGRLLFPDFAFEDASAWTQEVWREYKHDGPFFDGVFSPLSAHLDPLWPIRACFEIIEDHEKPKYVDWVEPETKRKVKMMRWVPEHLLCLPNRFYTVVLTDHDLVRKAEAQAPRPAGRRTSDSSSRTAFHNLYGLNCYMPNFLVPGHRDQKAAQKATEELLADL